MNGGPILPEAPGIAHFVGIGGVGMAGVAWLLHQLGWSVSGCDAHHNPLLDRLRAEGVGVRTPHDPAHLDETRPDLVVRTPAVPDDAPELVRARALEIPIVPRGEILAALSSRIPTLAVCGSHGKTTTSTFLASILHALRPKETAWCIGGVSRNLPAVAGGVLRTLVAEADESDGTLARYEPTVTVVTNVDLDHVDRFPSVEAFEHVFSAVVARTRGPVIFCVDSPRTAAVCTASRHAHFSFGFSPAADWRIEDFEPAADAVRFRLRCPGREDPLPVFLPVPGRHNALNAAAAVAAAAAVGIAPEDALRVLSQTATLPARRFETIGTPGPCRVISDYSHHPSEIRALVETAAALPHKRLRAVFQPHRYTRTRTLLEDFPPAFRGLDELVLCPVYAASEAPLLGGSSASLYEAFRRQAASDAALPIPVFAESADDAAAYVEDTLLEGDLVLVVGAGDVAALAPRLAAAAPVPALPPSLALSAYGTKAPARGYRAIRSLDALRETLRACEAPTLLGGGTNTLVAATGFRKPLVRLLGPDFSFVRETPGGLRVGVATPGSVLLDFCRRHGYTGLEVMANIPGVVGGWLAMNAGTRFGAFCDRVSSVRGLRADGSEVTLEAAALHAAYRTCPGLRAVTALEVDLRLDRKPPEEVAALERSYAERRLDFSGMRTCGSVFKNPPDGLTAGQLSDRALCKGLRVGGARICARHANVIETDATATASDVQALLHLVQERVFFASGTRLALEVRLLH